MNADATFKICIFGDSGVGKTTLAQRYITGKFQMDTRATIGASILVKYLTLQEKKIALQIWDFGGEDKFRFLLPVYASGSSAGIFLYDLTNKETLNNINDWTIVFKQGLSEEERKKTPIIMVGTKLDMMDKRSVDINEAVVLGNQNQMHDHFETSSKTGENIDDLFSSITEVILKHKGTKF